MKNKVAIGIVKKDDKILIVRRKKKEKILLWQFPGGEIKRGETDKKAVVREINEETGLQVKVVKLLGNRVHPSTRIEMSYGACEYVSGNIVISDDDLDKAIGIEADDVSSYLTTLIYPEVLDYLQLLVDNND